MKLLFIFIVSFVVLGAYAGQNETSTPSGLSSTTSEAPSCGPNEEYKTCKCPRSDLCMIRIAHKPCVLHVPGCRCREGYLRRSLGSPCRPKKECPKFGK